MNTEEIISKYLCRSATEEEKEFLLQWLEEKDENKKEFKRIYDLWLYSNACLTDDTETEKAWVSLKKKMTSRKKDQSRTQNSRLYLLRITASILLLLSAGYLGYIAGTRTKPELITMNHLLTGADGKGEYLLPDGSIVWLNAKSVLKYPEPFTGETRTVYLEGEGLFEIKKDDKKPFCVKAGGLDIEVTGTRFLARNYTHKKNVETVLINGSIKVSGDYFDRTRILHPGELLTYNKQTKQIGLHQVNTDDYINWTQSKLVFDKTNLEQVIINLEKWFDVEIIAEPELIRNTHMSFTVRRESLEQVLSYMSLTAPIDYKLENDILYLYQKK